MPVKWFLRFSGLTPIGLADRLASFTHTHMGSEPGDDDRTRRLLFARLSRIATVRAQAIMILIGLDTPRRLCVGGREAILGRGRLAL